MRQKNKNICPDEVSMTFICTIKTRRKKIKLTQESLASILGVNRASVSYYESGKSLPSLHVLMKLAALFGCDLSSSVNWKYYHGHVRKDNLMKSLKRYGFTYSELGVLLGYDASAVKSAVNFGHGFSLECLSNVLRVIEDERMLSKFRRRLS